MKVLSLFLSLILCLSLSVTAFGEVALEEYETVEGDVPLEVVAPDVTLETEIEDLKQTVEDLKNEVDTMSESNNVVDTPVEDFTSEEPEINPETELPVSVSLMSVAPITPEDTSGLKAVLLSVIGDYDPVIVEYEYQNSNNYSSYLREVLPDYPWCASFFMLALFVYCIFRLGGALFNG